jgi:hypothetical protein
MLGKASEKPSRFESTARSVNVHEIVHLFVNAMYGSYNNLRFIRLEMS